MSRDWYKVAQEERARANYYLDLVRCGHISLSPPHRVEEDKFMTWEDISEKDKTWADKYRFDSKVELTL